MKHNIDFSFHPGSWALPLWVGYSHYRDHAFEEWVWNLGFLCFSLNIWLDKEAALVK